MIFLGMKKKHLMVIDPAVEKPAIESFNRLSIRAPYPTSYHLPALHGMNSIYQLNKKIRGVIILGSAASVHDDNKWQKALTTFLFEIIDKDLPIMGLCYGHQLIAHIFGGKVGPLWNGEKKQGVRDVTLTDNELWGERKKGPMIFSHQDGVTECPNKFEIIAHSNMVSVDGFRIKKKPIWGFQTHIEATKAFINDHNIPISENSGAIFKFGHKILDKFKLSLV